jgi:hypothetical protein
MSGRRSKRKTHISRLDPTHGSIPPRDSGEGCGGRGANRDDTQSAYGVLNFNSDAPSTILRCYAAWMVPLPRFRGGG